MSNHAPLGSARGESFMREWDTGVPVQALASAKKVSHCTG